MFSHGAMTALFFACVGIVYDRAHTRDIPSLGGMGSKLPWVAVAFIIGGLVSMGMPGFSGFIAELPIMLGLWEAGKATSDYFIAPYYTWIVMIAVIAIVITASYILRAVQRVFFGQMPAEFEGHISHSTGMDKVAIALLAGVLVLLGVFPGLMAPLISSGAENVMAILGGIRAGHGCAGELEFTRRADRNEGCLLRIKALQILDQCIIPLAPMLVGRDDFHGVTGYVQRIAAFGIGRSSRDDDRPIAEFHEILTGISSHIRFLDSSGQRTLASHREAPGSRSAASRQHPRRQDQEVVGPERLAIGITFFEQDAG